MNSGPGQWECTAFKERRKGAGGGEKQTQMQQEEVVSLLAFATFKRSPAQLCIIIELFFVPKNI